jgi:hypothetical protein
MSGRSLGVVGSVLKFGGLDTRRRGNEGTFSLCLWASFPRRRESRAGSRYGYRFLISFIGSVLCATSPASETFDHSAWDRILGETVKNGVVDYGKIRERYPELQNYLQTLESAEVDSLSREDRIAFYLNAYNAHTIDGVLSHGEIGSVNEAPEFFKNTKFVLAGEEQSLDSLEQTTLRQLGEPRIHFALVRASKSSPKLASKAYTGKSLDEDLDKRASDFFLDPSKNLLDREKGILYMSRILKWNQDDFTRASNSVLAFIRPYLSAEDRAYLDQNPGKVKVEYLEFDWSLNGHH